MRKRRCVTRFTALALAGLLVFGMPAEVLAAGQPESIGKTGAAAQENPEESGPAEEAKPAENPEENLSTEDMKPAESPEETKDTSVTVEETVLPKQSGANEITTVDGFVYKVLSQAENTVEITGYEGSDTKIVIPDEIDGYSVGSIGYAAFQNCGNLASVEIPEGVSSIGNRAFYYCSSLPGIEIIMFPMRTIRKPAGRPSR